MPRVFKIGGYWVYFWSDEQEPLEPVHVHIAEGKPIKQATKVWITKAGKCLLANNNSHIPERILKNIIRIIEARSSEVMQKWENILVKSGTIAKTYSGESKIYSFLNR